LVGRLTNISKDILGRCTTTKLIGKDGKIVNIITAYQCPIPLVVATPKLYMPSSGLHYVPWTVSLIREKRSSQTSNPTFEPFTKIGKSSSSAATSTKS
jgi:hypothetical protein